MRIRLVLDQSDLSGMSGVSKGAIGRLEADKIVNPQPNTIRKIAGAFGVSPAWLVTGKGNGLPSNAQQSGSAPPTGIEGESRV